MLKKYNWFLNVLISFLLIFITFVSFSNIPKPVSADVSNAIEVFDNQNVMVDLESSDVKVDEIISSTSEISFLTLYEFGYTAFNRDYYAVYVYIYVPESICLNENGNNSIELADKFSDYTNNIAVRYDNFDLKFCNKSTDSFFYKFRVLNFDACINNESYSFVNRTFDKRVYNVAGIQLDLGENNSVEILKPSSSNGINIYSFARSFIYTGFNKGCGVNPDSESSLSCEVNYFEALELNVQHTNWRSESSDKGINYQNEVNSVYFKMPKRLLDEYGKLQKIHAEWYEYITSPVYVTSNSDFYNSVIDWVGKSCPTDKSSAKDIGWSFYNKDLFPTDSDLVTVFSVDGYSVLSMFSGIFIDFENKYYNFWNLNISDEWGTEKYINPIDKFYYLFLDCVDGVVSKEELEDWFINYTNSHPNSSKIHNKYSSDLFSSNDNSAYHNVNIDLDTDVQDIISWTNTEPNFWQKCEKFGFWDVFWNNYDMPVDDSKTISPIYIVEDSDLLLSSEVLSDSLLINEKDINDFKSYYNSKTDDEVVVLLRFSVDDYYRGDCVLASSDNFLLWDKHIKNQLYVSQEKVFLDFDIIDLTFRSDDVDTVIPVIMSPFDIINDITPSPSFNPISQTCHNYKTILAVVFVLFFAVIVWFILNKVFKRKR